MRLVVFVLIGLCCGVPGRAQDPPPQAPVAPPVSLTEREAVKRAMAENPRLRSFAARVAEVRALQADRALWPNPSAAYTRESAGDAHDTFVLARQEIPISGRRARLQSAGRHAVEAAEAEARYHAARLQADVRAAYGQLLLAQERERVIRDSIGTLQQLIAMLRVREKEGEGSTYDRMRGERALVDLDAELIAAAAARVQAAAQLAGHFGAGAEATTLSAVDSLIPTAPSTPLATLIEKALASRQDYRATRLSVTRFEAEGAAANLLRVPTPTLTGGLKRSEVNGAASSGYQFSVDVTVPIFNRGTTGVALAGAQRARAEADAEASRILISAEVTAALRVLQLQHDRATRYRDSAANVAEPLARIGRVAYEEGEVGILELLDAERQALDARLRLLELAAAVRQAAIDLDRVTGEEFQP